MIPPEFDYVAPESLEEAIRLLSEGGEDAKLLAGGHSLIPLMKLRLAAPSLLVDLRKVPGSARHPAGERALPDRRDDHAPDGRVHARAQARRPGGGHDRRPAGAQPRHARRHAGPRRPGGRHAGHPASRTEGSVTAQGPGGQREIAAADLFQDYLTSSLAADEIITEVRVPGARRLRLRLSEVQPPRRGLGDGGGVRAGQEGRGRDVRGRPGRAEQHGQRAAAGHVRGAGAAGAPAGRAVHRRRGRAGGRGHRARRRTSTPPPTTSATWRA